MKYRFTPQMIFEIVMRSRDRVIPGDIDSSDAFAIELNKVLEEWEADSETVYGHCIQCKPAYRWYKKMWFGSKSPHGRPTHQAILWNPKEIECKK